MRWPWQRRRRDDRRELRGIIYEAVAAGSSSVEASPEEAMRLATVYACVDRIASTISTLPVDLYEETPAGKRELREHPLARLLRVAPNEFQTPADFFGYITRCALIVGDAYVRIYRHEETGDVVRLLPIDPRRVETRLHPSRHRLIYYVEGDPLPPDSVWHIRGLPGRDYLQSASPIRAAAELIDAGRASVRLQRAVAENAAQPRDLFESDGTLDADEAQRFLDDWREKTSGPNAGGAYILPVGLRHRQLALSHEDKQFVDSRRLTADEIIGIYGLPRFMVMGDSPLWTEEMQTYFSQVVIRPWVVRIEQSFARDVLLPSEQGRIYMRFNLDALMRATLQSRTAAYQNQIAAGLLTINEARALEDRPPLPGGDVYFAPLSLAHVDATTGQIIYNGPQNPIPTTGGDDGGTQA